MYGFYIDYDVVNNNVIDIHNYVMKKHDIK